MSIASAIKVVEGGISHIVTIVEEDTKKIIGYFHVVNGDVKGAYDKFIADAQAEVAAIEAKAKADVAAVTAKVSSVKSVLGL